MWRFSLVNSENRHKRRQRANLRVAPMGAGRCAAGPWRQCALGRGANERCTAPIVAGVALRMAPARLSVAPVLRFVGSALLRLWQSPSSLFPRNRGDWRSLSANYGLIHSLLRRGWTAKSSSRHPIVLPLRANDTGHKAKANADVDRGTAARMDQVDWGGDGA